MANTTVVLQTADSAGNDYQQTVTYINPKASDAVLCGFAKQFNSFSTDSLKDVYRIDKQLIKEG